MSEEVIMSTIGNRMFKGATVGAGLGAVGGGIYGAIKAQNLIDNPPVDTVEIGGYERPMFVERTVGGNFHFGWDGVDAGRVKATFPVQNANGTIKTEYISPQSETGLGKGSVEWIEHDILEPQVSRDINGSGGLNTRTHVDYVPTGETWLEPSVKFDTSVNKGAHILGYAAVGALAGGVGGALVAAAIGGKDDK